MGVIDTVLGYKKRLKIKNLLRFLENVMFQLLDTLYSLPAGSVGTRDTRRQCGYQTPAAAAGRPAAAFVHSLLRRGP